jgi:tripartite ATP-independent transporter DctM subunit
MAPVILLAGLLTGYFSPTEVAAVCAAYAIVIGVFVYREMNWRGFVNMVRETTRQTGNIMFIIAAAAIFSLALTLAGVPDKLNAFFLGFSTDPVVLLLMTNLLLLVVGMFMETIAALLILTPILVPTLVSAGVDPIHLGLVVVLNLMVGLLTPPVGMSLYLVSIMSGISVQRVVRAMLPYYIPLIAALVMVTLLPDLATWLPNLIYSN